MKKSKWTIRLIAIAVFTASLVLVQSCKDDEPPALSLVSLTANGIDLNGATTPNNVPIDAVVTATFSTNVNPATISGITIYRDYDKANVDVDITVKDNVATITPKKLLGTGTLLALKIAPTVTSDKGKALADVSRSFTTVGTFAPDGAFAQWTFEDNANDIIGSFDPTPTQIVDLTYLPSRNTASGKAASFNGTTSIVEISNGSQLMDATDFTISFWVKPNSQGHVDAAGNPKGHFVMGLGAFFGFQFEIRSSYGGGQFPLSYKYQGGDDTITEGFGFNADGKNRDKGGWQGWDFVADLTGSGGLANVLKDKWVHVVYTFNSSTKKITLYFNGTKIQSGDFNLWPDGDKKKLINGTKFGGKAPDVLDELAFGFVQSRGGKLWNNEPWGDYTFPTSNHFRGLLDDVVIYKKAISEAEIALMYSSGKP